MIDRGMKKWKPFNSVVPSSELKNTDVLKEPSLSENEILYFEELLKQSLYTKIKLKITFLYNNKKLCKEKTVKRINNVNKNIYFTDNTYINFRQIYKVEKK